MAQSTITNLVDQTGINNIKPTTPDAHDLRVVLFHVILAAVQAILLQLGKENFGTYTVYVALFVQVAGEFVRRIIV